MNYDNAIFVKNLSKNYGQYQALKNFSIRVPKGKIYGLLGANGAGKTTFMKILLGLLHLTEGEIQVLGKDIGGEDKRYLSQIGSLIETPVFYSGLTVEENLVLHCEYLQKNNRGRIPEILELVGISGAQKRKIKELSLGMKQRLAIGRALLGEPELLILDEPINGVDPEGIIEIRHLLLKLSQEHNVTILVSSHIINEMEKIADLVGIMQEGQIVAEVSKNELQNSDFSLEKYFIDIMQRNNLKG